MANFKYDAFLSFAVEDKDSIANLLYDALTSQGLNIWYSGREFQLGVSVKDQIKEGLEQSRFGILLITPNYFQTNWAQKELGALWGKEREDYKIIIPVFHGITPEEVGSQDPDLAERWSVILTTGGFKKAAEKIRQKIKDHDHIPVKKQRKKKLASLTALMVFTLLSIWRTMTWGENTMTESQIRQMVDHRISQLNSQVAAEWMELETGAAIPATQAMVQKQLGRFDRIKGQFRNYYQFDNGLQTLQFEKNVGPVTGIDFNSWSAANDYGMTFPRISMFVGDRSKGLDLQVHYFNTQPVSYEIEHVTEEDTSTIAIITYEESLRMVKFHYESGPWTSQRKHTTYSIRGFKLKEVYHFILDDGEWQLAHIE